MPNITIIGGGFAGATLARRLVGRLPAGWEIVLVSEESYITYNPMLPEVVGAAIFPEQAVAPLREMINIAKGGRFTMGAVTEIDMAAREIVCATLVGERRFGFDHLVLACGTRARLDLIPGMADHALPLKSVGDALHIRNIVLRRLAAMELEPDAEVRARLGHFIVIGGGFSGVEVAGALIDCLHGIGKYFPHAMSDVARVSLVHNGDRLLPEMVTKLGAAALASLRRRGVDIRLNASAVAIDPEGIDLQDGGRMEAATVIATIGTMPNALVANLGAATERGRVVVDSHLAVPGLDRVWALGDCALAVNMMDGTPSPPTAQFAVAQAKQLADIIAATLAGRAPRQFDYKARGSMAAIGHLSGVAEVLGFSFSGLFAWFAWRAYYLLQLPTLGRKVRVYVEWTWGMFFAPDITHIHFTRSGGGSGAPMIVKRRTLPGDMDPAPMDAD